MEFLRGTKVHGEIVAPDANTFNVSGNLFDVSGVARTQAATESLVVTDFVITSVVTMTVQIYIGAGNGPASGERLAQVGLAAGFPTVVSNFALPFTGKPGKPLRILASAVGQVYITFNGVLV